MDEAQLDAKAAQLLEISDWNSLSDQEIADRLKVSEQEAVQIKAKAQRIMGAQDPGQESS